ncbi:ABC transporter permease [Bacillus benzoevorans]|uniref:ABC-2 type transport system permease protein n=1 Tax=Bacillus benzoevorans TaxID=1456 RepID=A0A7X0HTS0_9BACI|nr:ABC transporter permease [Bacillus benzoevorans]MBB6446673.1 ABC-2 type transport system permease protein [Bacillus benzoevorans]
MIGILLAKCKMFVRHPWVFISMTVMSIGFALLLGSSHSENTIQVPVSAENEAIRQSKVGEKLSNSDIFILKWMSEKEMRDRIETGKAEAGVYLQKDHFQIVVGVDTPNLKMIQQTVREAYMETMQEELIKKAANAKTKDEKAEIHREMENLKDSPLFKIDKNSFKGAEAFVYDQRYHTLFGFTLFFVIYTIAYNVLSILIEKRDGLWDRIILSPVKKWEMYLGNFIFSFLSGYVQILIILIIFRFIMGEDFNGKLFEVCLLLLPYVFSIVALSILITAVVKNAQQFNGVLPIVAVSSAMIGGAYWPIEIVESKFLMVLSKINPVTYGMELLNGAVVYRYPFEDLLFPMSILFLMGVVMTGIGIHLMERRHV